MYAKLISLFVIAGVVFLLWWSLRAEWVEAPASDSEPASEMNGTTTTANAAEGTTLDPAIAAHIAEKADLIVVDSPSPNTVIASPLTITGKARGYWSFEAGFPVVLTDWDGRIIAEHYAIMQGDWMTEDFVPFEATLTYESPYRAGDPDFMQRGTLILMRDNPSGLPENDDALEFPILFEMIK